MKERRQAMHLRTDWDDDFKLFIFTQLSYLSWFSRRVKKRHKGTWIERKEEEYIISLCLRFNLWQHHHQREDHDDHVEAREFKKKQTSSKENTWLCSNQSKVCERKNRIREDKVVWDTECKVKKSSFDGKEFLSRRTTTCFLFLIYLLFHFLFLLLSIPFHD